MKILERLRQVGRQDDPLGNLVSRLDRLRWRRCRLFANSALSIFEATGHHRIILPPSDVIGIFRVANALNKPVGGPLAGSCACQRTNLQFHQRGGGGARHVQAFRGRGRDHLRGSGAVFGTALKTEFSNWCRVMESGNLFIN